MAHAIADPTLDRHGQYDSKTGVFVSLTSTSILKQRYGDWWLINTRHPRRERLLVSGSEELLHTLFSGVPLTEACARFDVTMDELQPFVDALVSEGVIECSAGVTNCQSRCFALEPPLDGVNVLITNACNLHCAHCYPNSGHRSEHELDGREWIRVFEEAHRLGVFELNISGGEPLLHPDFLQIAEYIASVPTFHANLNTNGTVLREAHIDVIARAFTSVQVSIDDASPTRHDQFRGRSGCFERSMRTIEQLVMRGVETNVGFTLTPENLGALDGVVRLCESSGITRLIIGVVAEIGRASANQLVQIGGRSMHRDGAFMDQLYGELRRLADRPSPVEILLPFRAQRGLAVFEEKRFICDGDNTQLLYIMPDGNIMPCDKLPLPHFSYGNVRRDTLEEVWTAERMRAFKLMSPRHLTKCRECPHLLVCGGACVARAYHNGGSLDAPDWTSCEIAQRFARERASTQ